MEIWDEVIIEFNTEIDKLRVMLGNGGAEDYPHYRQMGGPIQGLDWARTNITDIIKKRTYSDDEE